MISLKIVPHSSLAWLDVCEKRRQFKRNELASLTNQKKTYGLNFQRCWVTVSEGDINCKKQIGILISDLTRKMRVRWAWLKWNSYGGCNWIIQGCDGCNLFHIFSIIIFGFSPVTITQAKDRRKTHRGNDARQERQQCKAASTLTSQHSIFFSVINLTTPSDSKHELIVKFLWAAK